jgi:predicted PurR-regulated permease PerM
MSSAAEILVVILSVALAIFIILGIALFVLLIKLTKQISETTTSVRNISASIDGLVQNIVQITSPVIITKTVLEFFKKINKKGKRK